MTNLITAWGLSKKYGSRTVLEHVDLSIAPRERLAIIGPNGAGKSTLLDLILGLKKPDQGKVTYWRKNPYPHIGLQLQSTPFFAGFTALENLRMFAAFYGQKPSREELMKLLKTCHLEEAAHTDAARLSGGQQKRLAIAMTLVHDPALIFLDEPTSALDPRARREIHELIMSLSDSGTAVVLTSHDMEEVYQLATRVILICSGRVLACGTPDELLTSHGLDNLEELYIQLTAQ